MKVHTEDSRTFEEIEQDLSEKFRARKKALFNLIEKLHTEGYDTEEDQFYDAKKVSLLAIECEKIKDDQKKVFQLMINSMKEVEER